MLATVTACTCLTGKHEDELQRSRWPNRAL